MLSIFIQKLVDEYSWQTKFHVFLVQVY